MERLVGVDCALPGIDGARVLSSACMVDWLERQIEERAPAAVVRFGDVEACLLTADPEKPESMSIAAGKLANHTGVQFSQEAVLSVQRMVSRAFDEADVLGILFDDETADAQMNRLTSLYLERAASGRPPAALASSHLHHIGYEMLRGRLAGRRASVIACRDVKAVLEADWGLRDVVVHQVPSEHMLREVDSPYERKLYDVPIWPDVHSRITRELTVRERGEVFLVGAGPFGKDLCVQIRDNGGFAFDFGSAFDRMVGKVTRGVPRRIRLLHARGASVDEIAERLEAYSGAQIDRAAIRKLTDEAAPHMTCDPFGWAWAERKQ